MSGDVGVIGFRLEIGGEGRDPHSSGRRQPGEQAQGQDEDISQAGGHALKIFIELLRTRFSALQAFPWGKNQGVVTRPPQLVGGGAKIYFRFFGAVTFTGAWSATPGNAR